MLFDMLIVRMCVVWVTWQNLCSEIHTQKTILIEKLLQRLD